MSSSHEISATDLGQLHPRVLDQPAQVLDLLETARALRVPLLRGMNRAVEPESAILVGIERDGLKFETKNFNHTGREQIFFRFEVDGTPYFFGTRRLSEESVSPLHVTLPSAIYQQERRERLRSRLKAERDTRLVAPSGEATPARVLDLGPGGASVLVPATADFGIGDVVELETKRAPRDGARGRAKVVGTSSGSAGWTRLHLNTAAPSSFVDPTYRDSVLDQPLMRKAWQRLKVGIGAGAAMARKAIGLPHRALKVELVRYSTEDGEEIVGILDSVGEAAGGTAVIIPPAWGRTKETLMPLAEVLLTSFAEAGEAVSVLRFDGVRKRGESHNDPEFRGSGKEHLGFTFYQGVRDIRASVRFAKEELSAARVILVTFSAASVEGRKFLAEDAGSSVDGWVAVVGTADMQSMMRVISGGVDYCAGIERGIKFGYQEILGVTVDIDVAGDDALEHQMAFMEDSRRDFEAISVPIRWVHGKYDAWMDLGRIREVLACGSAEGRRLEVVPCGHQLRSSSEALQVFQRVAEHVAEVVGASGVSSSPPSVSRLAAKSIAERARLKTEQVDLRDFWSDYLLGRTAGLGIELMNRTPAYQEFMSLQIEALRLSSGARVLDIGAGVGPLFRQLPNADVEVVSVDLVPEALARGRLCAEDSGVLASFVACDLEAGGLPLASASVDAVLASLFLSYLGNPESLLAEFRRVLRPGGRLVISTMKPDADLSLIYTDALAAIGRGEFDDALPGVHRAELLAAGRSFLNDAARLIDLEEQGTFKFWDETSFRKLARSGGFDVSGTTLSFGEPGQAIVLVATRR